MDKHHSIDFLLAKQELIEMIKARNTLEALQFATVHLAPFGQKSVSSAGSVPWPNLWSIQHLTHPLDLDSPNSARRSSARWCCSRSRTKQSRRWGTFWSKPSVGMWRTKSIPPSSVGKNKILVRSLLACRAE